MWKEKQTDDYLGYGKSRAPLLFQNVKTDAAITVDIRVIDLGAERNLHHIDDDRYREKAQLIEHSL